MFGKRLKYIEFIFPIFLILVAAAIVSRRAVSRFVLTGDLESIQIYTYIMSIYRPNYFDNGFIRRGLYGTLLHIFEGLSAPSYLTVTIFFVISAVALSAAMALMLHRLMQSGDRLWPWFAGFIVLSPQLFWGWSRDFGRGDMFAYTFVVWSVIAALGGRFTLASIILFLGSLAHEITIIYGGPLLVTIWFLKFRQQKARVNQVVAALLVLLALLALAALAQRHLGDDLSGILKTVLEGQQRGESAPVAVTATYLNWGGVGSIAASVCLISTQPWQPWVILACFLVLLANFRVLFDQTLVLKLIFGFVSVVPMTFLTIVAIDYGRWLILAVANAWLAKVAIRLMGIETTIPSKREMRVSGLVFAVLVAMGPAGIWMPNLLVEKLALPERVFTVEEQEACLLKFFPTFARNWPGTDTTSR